MPGSCFVAHLWKFSIKLMSVVGTKLPVHIQDVVSPSLCIANGSSGSRICFPDLLLDICLEVEFLIGYNSEIFFLC